MSKIIKNMESGYNGFKELEKSIIKDQTPQITRVQQNINGTKNTFNFIGNIVDIYLPNVMATISKMMQKK